jgi:hypothetical protein
MSLNRELLQLILLMRGRTANFLSIVDALLMVNLTVMSGQGCSMLPKYFTLRLALADKIVHNAGVKLSVDNLVR